MCSSLTRPRFPLFLSSSLCGSLAHVIFCFLLSLSPWPGPCVLFHAVCRSLASVSVLFMSSSCCFCVLRVLVVLSLPAAFRISCDHRAAVVRVLAVLRPFGFCARTRLTTVLCFCRRSCWHHTCERLCDDAVGLCHWHHSRSVVVLLSRAAKVQVRCGFCAAHCRCSDSISARAGWVSMMRWT